MLWQTYPSQNVLSLLESDRPLILRFIQTNSEMLQFTDSKLNYMYEDSYLPISLTSSVLVEQLWSFEEVSAAKNCSIGSGQILSENESTR